VGLALVLVVILAALPPSGGWTDAHEELFDGSLGEQELVSFFSIYL
jgi:hypothetical protein